MARSPEARPKLTPQLLLSDDGIGYVLCQFQQNFKYLGRGHEVLDQMDLIQTAISSSSFPQAISRKRKESGEGSGRRSPLPRDPVEPHRPFLRVWMKPRQRLLFLSLEHNLQPEFDVLGNENESDSLPTEQSSWECHSRRPSSTQWQLMTASCPSK